MKNLPKMVVYQLVLKAERNGNTIKWLIGDEVIDELLLNFPWKHAFEDYNRRGKFYFGFSISGHGSELFPVIDAKVEGHKASLSNPEFLIEVASMPAKLASVHRKALEKLLSNKKLLERDDFKIWWEDDPRGPRKRKLKDKLQIVEQVRGIKQYVDEDDLKLEDAEVTPQEALLFFGFEKNASQKDVKDKFKAAYRQLQLQHHPDAESGSDESFLYLQKCHNILKAWMR